MREELGKLIRESFEKQYNAGLELGEAIGRNRVLDEQRKLQSLHHRNFHKIFRPFCWLFGHSWNPLWCACKICYMSGEEMIQRNTDKEKGSGAEK